MYLNDLFDLRGQVAVITGGLGTIGQAYAQGLATYGADTILLDRNSNGAQDILNKLRNIKRKAEFFQMDLLDVRQIEATVNKILDRFGKIDILVNHAGLNIRKPALELAESEWDAILDINLKGMFFMAREVGKVMVKQGRGKMINTASVSSVRGHPRLVAYAASKGGVIQMTKVLANEWARHNVQVNAIGPGYIRTQQTEEFLEDSEAFRHIVEKIPMGRVGTPDDLVGGCIFLASRASDYVTGQTLFIEGGRLID